MLVIDMEAFKGILFIKLKGEFNYKTIDVFNNEVTYLVKDSIVRNIVFDLEDLDNIDNSGIFEIMNNFKWCKDNNGLSLICNAKGDVKRIIDKTELYQAKNQLEAVKIFNI